MFKANTGPYQRTLVGGTVNELSDKKRNILEDSWAETFRQEVLLRIDEHKFVDLYSLDGSRPNIAVNVLVCWEIIKTGQGLSDRAMHDRFLFDIQVRHALGLDSLNDGDFTLRTVYNFRNRLSEYEKEEEINLIHECFRHVTDEQMRVCQVNSSQLRVDSVQVASNIAQMSRLQLVIDSIRRVESMLTVEDGEKYKELLSPWTGKRGMNYVYDLEAGSYGKSFEQAGVVLQQLVEELRSEYSEEEVYETMCRIFSEQYKVEEGEVESREAGDIPSGSVQSPDDPEATYRRKAGKGYRGYVTNITETANPENDIQLIVEVQTEPNTADDAQLLLDALPELQERTDVEEVHVDGGYNSPELDAALEVAEIEQHVTAIRGSQPDPNRIGLAQFDIDCDEDGVPIQITCPQGQEIPVETGRNDQRFIARPDSETCSHCPLLAICAAKPTTLNAQPVIYFSKQQLRNAHKRQRIDQQREGPHLRPAVEATVRSLTHPLPHGKVPMRGQFKVTCFMLYSAMMVNARRIFGKSLNDKDKSTQNTPLQPQISSFMPLYRFLRHYTTSLTLYNDFYLSSA